MLSAPNFLARARSESIVCSRFFTSLLYQEKNMDLTTFHPLHAAGFGLAAGVTAKALGFENDQAVIAGAVVGGGTYAYMTMFGHSLPWGDSAIPTTMPRGGSPATPPKKAANVWGNIEASAVKQVQAFDAAVKKTSAQITAAQPAATPRALASIKAIPFQPLRFF